MLYELAKRLSARIPIRTFRIDRVLDCGSLIQNRRDLRSPLRMLFVRRTAAILAMSAAALLSTASSRAQDPGAPAMAAQVAPEPGQRLAPGTPIPPAELE